MRSFLLVAATLHLFSSVLGVPAYEFGDIIAFPKIISCNPKCTDVTYKHYAVYVGDRMFEGTNKKPDEDMFHFNGLVMINGLLQINCVFAKIDPKLNPYIDNYFDDKNYIKAPDHLIIEHIMQKYHNCPGYHPFANNCEHLATFVRYGVGMSLQLGTKVAKKCRNGRNHDIQGTQEILDDIANLETDDKHQVCSITCPKYYDALP